MKKIFLFILCGIFTVLFVIYLCGDSEKEKVTIKKQLVKIDSLYGKTKKEASLFNVDGDVIGSIGKDVYVSFEDNKIVKNKLLKLSDFEDCYIEYKNISSEDEIPIKSDRYRKYVLFDENVVTSDKTGFYDNDNNLVYEFKKSFSLPIIIKDDKRYGVEFNNELLFINNDDIKEVIKHENSSDKVIKGVPVLNYHFVYEEDDTSCDEEICHPSSQIEEHFKYLIDNDFFTLKLKELEMYIDGKILLPEKSVVLTFDDGTRADVAKKYVDKYKVNAALFLITSWFSKDEFESEYFEVHSHGDNIHDGGKCPGGQGGAIKCLDKDLLLDDLKTSRKKLNDTTYFCYPFYEYNNYSIEVLKEAGFTMAFAGEYAGHVYKASVGVDKFKIPRLVIVNWTTMDKFISYVNGGE